MHVECNIIYAVFLKQHIKEKFKVLVCVMHRGWCDKYYAFNPNNTDIQIVLRPTVLQLYSFPVYRIFKKLELISVTNKLASKSTVMHKNSQQQTLLMAK